MLQWLSGLLYESTPAEFRSSYSVAESVKRLSAATSRSAFSAVGETRGVGKVSPEGVRMQRVIPMVRNGFKPFFVGRFEIRDGVTMLTGHFGMSVFTKIFMTIWLGLVALAASVTPLAHFSSKISDSVSMAMTPLFMLAAGLGFIGLGKWFARNDAAWLSAVIAQASGTPGLGASADHT